MGIIENAWVSMRSMSMEVSWFHGTRSLALKPSVMKMWYLDLKADKDSKRACGDKAEGRLYVTATRILMLPFFRSAIRYSGWLVNLDSDLISIVTVLDLQMNSASPPQERNEKGKVGVSSTVCTLDSSVWLCICSDVYQTTNAIGIRIFASLYSEWDDF